MKTTLLAAAAAALLAGSAHASLLGTDLDVTVTHTGVPGSLAGVMGGTHTYGTSDVYQNVYFGSFTVTTPVSGALIGAPMEAYDNTLELDFNAFSYVVFSGETGMAIVSNLAEAVVPGSVSVFAGNATITLDVTDLPTGFMARWMVDDVIAFSPSNHDVVVAWNSVPAPGALALLSLAGLTMRTRRRRG